MTFAEHLAALGWTQAEFARVLAYLSGAPLDRNTVSRWALGKMAPKPAVIALCALLMRLPAQSRTKLLREARQAAEADSARAS